MTLREYLDSLRGKRLVVIGAGISNRPLIGLLADAGLTVEVRDRSQAQALGDICREWKEKGVGFRLGDGYLDDLRGDVIFRTPGLHPHHPALRQASHGGALVTSEMEVFLSLCPCRVFAVTGSDGKTTTTTLISELLREAGMKVWLGGNIGRPLLAETDRIAPEDAAVLELSSFQLHSMRCAPDVAVITNLAPNHLDVHPDYADYVAAKKQIFLHQKPGARLVLNLDNGDTRACGPEAVGQVRWFSRREKIEGAFLREDRMLCLCEGGEVTEVLPAAELLIPGEHNIENMLCAFAAVSGFAGAEAMRAVARRFTGVAHRLEKIRVLRGVTYINDSIASSPNRTIAGLRCFPEKVILMAGGKDKGISYDALGPVVCERVKKLFLTGMTAGVIRASVENAPGYRPGAPEIYEYEGFEETIRAAAAAAREGDVVLMSPASTSFDRFRNFEERGDTFRAVVEALS